LVARNEALMLNSLSRVTHLSQAANLPLTDFTDIHRKNLWRSVASARTCVEEFLR